MFSSTLSEARARATVAAFLAPFRGEQRPAENETQSVAASLAHKPKLTKSQKVRKNREINRKAAEDKRFRNLVKFKTIKNHKNISADEAAYLQRLILRNAKLVKSQGDIENDAIREEIAQLRLEILNMGKKAKEEVVQIPKTLAQPGLTPGLAPVDSEEESD